MGSRDKAFLVMYKHKNSLTCNFKSEAETSTEMLKSIWQSLQLLGDSEMSRVVPIL